MDLGRRDGRSGRSVRPGPRLAAGRHDRGAHQAPAGNGARHKAPVLDQYDFVAGGLGITALLFPAWIASRYVSGDGIVALVTLLVFVPVLHRTVNIIGYKMGKKKEPW